MAVVDGGQHLLDYVCSVCLGKVLLRCDSLEKFTSIAKPNINQKQDIREFSELFESSGYLSFAHERFRCEWELATRDKDLLSDEEVPLVVLEKFVELKDIWMIQLLQNTDL